MEEEEEEEEEKQQKLKSINEILPLELIQRILLRVPVKQLARLRCVSKLWHSLISDPEFAESHLHHSAAPTHAFLLVRHSIGAHLIHPEQVFDDNNYAIKSISPFQEASTF
ncbi:hypothetical protein PIB30_067269 [Stylosanthes scabra]|uniref:F-box domain-containing protein n=1 Tax=Stylosanthes scabra TaxID=79078 RepID=A0ABU6WKX5_9FABA|nr:hypothetical protein [Stylosanthes scabra]